MLRVSINRLIEPETLRRYCNFGYARGHCARATESDADAVRLLVKAERGGVVGISRGPWSAIITRLPSGIWK